MRRGTGKKQKTRSQNSRKATFLVGIDEVGRGPIAGPVTLGLCLFLNHQAIIKSRMFRGVKESKQLSEAQREKWFQVMVDAQRDGHIFFCTKSVSANLIDKNGISWAIKKALNDCLDDMLESNTKITPKTARIKLDGGLKAPAHFPFQETIIKGDEREIVIALASIAAKVTRDRYMSLQAKNCSGFGFDIHKGYGTRRHYAALRKYGITKLHRKSFLKLYTE